ncbi:hypothetical protein HPB50_012106 [Hyalomma asiaticum]|uniref:Uncharacterized protein n=1 Tax=Hyalomma asiaticum TaxID=266040 RepID=A0ACB7S4J0_HYAAI|nr:hypothetical protein HPB50_012106 [Hyalomma asiaticum]
MRSCGTAEAVARGKMAGRRVLVALLLLLLLAEHSSGAKKAKQAADSDVIEDVSGKQLENLLQTEEYLAVFFCEWQRNYFGHTGNRLIGPRRVGRESNRRIVSGRSPVPLRHVLRRG